MADEEPQGPEDTSWWAIDAFGAAEAPAASFDEPLVWPEALPWGDSPVTAIAVPDDTPFFPPDPAFGELFHPLPGAPAVAGGAAEPDLDAAWQASADEYDGADSAWQVGPLAALGGAPGIPPPPSADYDLLDDLLPATMWDAHTTGDVPAVAGGDAGAVYAETDAGRHRLRGRAANMAVLALISVASLVLLSMFLTARGGDEVPTDASQTRPQPQGDGIQVTGTLNTIPLPTVTTPGPPGTINLTELIPADTPASTAAPRPVTTAAPAATQPATTAATTTTPATTTTAQPDTTQTTARRTTTSLDLSTTTSFDLSRFFPSTTTIPRTSTSWNFPMP